MKRITKTTKTKLPADAYDRTPRFTITVTDESCWLTRHDSKGKPASTYPVNVADLGAAFNAFEASTGLLPEGVLFWQRTAQTERVAIWLPPARREIAWRNGKRIQHLSVPLPGFVFVGAGAQYWIFAAKERPANERVELYHAPLPNVHADGMICAGNVQFPRCTLSTIHAAATLFFGSEFNHDLSSNKIEPALPHPIPRAAERPHGGVPQRAESLFNFYRALDGKKQFPMQRLARLLRAGVAELLGIQCQQPAGVEYEGGYDLAGVMDDAMDEAYEDAMEDDA